MPKKGIFSYQNNIFNRSHKDTQMPEKEINSFKQVLDYEFRDKKLLKEALTHKSYASEKKLKYDNQRLEFLGDAVIETVLSEYLFKMYPNYQEGKLTKIRSAIVRKESLAKMASNLGWGDFLRLGKGEKNSGGAAKLSSLCDLFEAVIGALFLDSGYDTVKSFITELIDKEFPNPDKLLDVNNPKGDLQEFTQQKFGCIPKYELIESAGPDHDPVYTYKVVINGKEIATGSAGKKKKAESLTAELALKKLKTEKSAKS